MVWSRTGYIICRVQYKRKCRVPCSKLSIISRWWQQHEPKHRALSKHGVLCDRTRWWQQSMNPRTGPCLSMQSWVTTPSHAHGASRGHGDKSRYSDLGHAEGDFLLSRRQQDHYTTLIDVKLQNGLQLHIRSTWGALKTFWWCVYFTLHQLNQHLWGQSPGNWCFLKASHVVPIYFLISSRVFRETSWLWF